MSARNSRRGGPRKGAGRKRSRERQHDPQHDTRPSLQSKHPLHVILRTVDGVPRLRQRKIYKAIRNVLLHYVEHSMFRIVHISIQHNHLHLIVEAANKRSLTRGMQSFAIRTARAINKALGRKGKVFRFRYNAKQIQTREYARNVLAYVLNNWRRHNEDVRSAAARNATLDPYSSAISFTGWIGNPQWQKPPWYAPLPVSAPRTDLLRSAWLWRGLIDPFEVPAANDPYSRPRATLRGQSRRGR
jgi:REP element-mobilizing transposase RayT